MNFQDPSSLSEDELESSAVFAPRFGSGGLITAIAVDHADGQVLMVAHMNQEALRMTLETGTVHYWSRSRQSLWKKGETSGETQRLIEMRTDCDQDAIVMKVEQLGHGAACHTGRKSCFYRRVDLENGTPRLIMDSEPPLFDPEKVYS
ncbi:MAG: phosphoribosyl-AMP cyclohydrolase [Hyphomicrobiaceae bacterium]|nr:phosphoribosyl-AMP cyclohydrolase [Hyphomicrobiaceae bacterium]